MTKYEAGHGKQDVLIDDIALVFQLPLLFFDPILRVTDL